MDKCQEWVFDKIRCLRHKMTSKFSDEHYVRFKWFHEHPQIFKVFDFLLDFFKECFMVIFNIGRILNIAHILN